MKNYFPAILFSIAQVLFGIGAWAAVPENLYSHFRGTLGDQKIVMNLIKVKEDLTGTYYYEKYGIPIVLRGNMTGEDAFVLKEYDVSGNEMLMTAKFGPDNEITGSWRYAGTDVKTLPLELNEIYSGGLKFDIYELSDNLAFEKGVSESPRAFIDLIFADVRTNSNKGSDRKIRDITHTHYFGQPVSEEDVKQRLERERDNYFKNCLGEYLEWKKGRDPSDSSYSAALNRELSRSVNIRCNEKGILSLEALQYEYSGGAHGNYGSKFLVLDLKKAKKLTLKDVIKTESLQALPDLLERKLREKYNIAPSVDLAEVDKLCMLVDAIEPTENFYLTPQGIGFYYNPYEIACYAHGSEDIFIPFKEMKGLLRPGFER